MEIKTFTPEFTSIVNISKRVKLIRNDMDLIAQQTAALNFDNAFINALQAITKVDIEISNVVRRMKPSEPTLF